jgi:hypothetical protein
MTTLTLQEVGMTDAEVAALPKRKTWYGIVGTSDGALVPWKLTDNADVAKAQATVANADYPLQGPWSVVALVENLRVTP